MNQIDTAAGFLMRQISAASRAGGKQSEKPAVWQSGIDSSDNRLVNRSARPKTFGDALKGAQQATEETDKEETGEDAAMFGGVVVINPVDAKAMAAEGEADQDSPDSIESFGFEAKIGDLIELAPEGGANAEAGDPESVTEITEVTDVPQQDSTMPDEIEESTVVDSVITENIVDESAPADNIVNEDISILEENSEQETGLPVTEHAEAQTGAARMPIRGFGARPTGGPVEYAVWQAVTRRAAREYAKTPDENPAEISPENTKEAHIGNEHIPAAANHAEESPPEPLAKAEAVIGSENIEHPYILQNANSGADPAPKTRRINTEPVEPEGGEVILPKADAAQIGGLPITASANNDMQSGDLLGYDSQNVLSPDDTIMSGDDLTETDLSKPLQFTHGYAPPMREREALPDIVSDQVFTVQARDTEAFTQIVERITTAYQGGKNTFEINLKPEFLGRMAITLSMEENGLTARIRTSSADTRGLISEQLIALENSLRDRGIEVVHMDVVHTELTRDFGGESTRQEWRGDQKRSVRVIKDEAVPGIYDMYGEIGSENSIDYIA